MNTFEGVITITKGERCKVELEHIGEGYNGDYDPKDADDAPLIRFTVYDGEEAMDRGSYCTNVTANAPEPALTKFADGMATVLQYIIETEGSIKNVCENFSHAFYCQILNEVIF